MLGPVVGVLAADGREAAAHRLLVDGHLAGVARHQDAHLALVDAREQLVDELPAGLLAALEVLAREVDFHSTCAGASGRRHKM